MQTPPDLRTNPIDWRTVLRCSGDESQRQRSLILARCKADIDFFVNGFVWQFNPNAYEKVSPFVLRPRQSEVLHSTIDRLFPREHTRLRHDVIWEKSREEGGSWLALILFAWRSLFYSRERFICVSHTADAVDRSGDPDCLFWKLDFINSHLPEWMNPPTKDDRIKFRITYPRTHSVITGQACSSTTTVGGRGVVLLDEFAKQKWAYEILHQTADVGPRLLISTHYGTGTAFYDQCRRPDVFKEQIHWTDNPEKWAGAYYYDDEKNVIVILDKTYPFPKDYPFRRTLNPTGGPKPGIRSVWYDAEDDRRNSRREMSMNVDIDPEGSGHQFFEPGPIYRLLKDTREPVWEGDIQLGAYGKASITRKSGGLLKLWTHPRGNLIPPGRYALAADIAAGTGASPSCLAIGNAQLGEKIGEYRNALISPQDFAKLCAALGHFFADEDGREALFCWENAGGVGAAFQKTFFECQYGNIYYHPVLQAFGAVRQDRKKPGWYPTDQGVRSLMESYKSALFDGRFLNPCKSALEDCLRFVHVKGGKIKHAEEEREADDPSAGRVNHGDQVLADALLNMLMEALGADEPEPDEPEAPGYGSWQWRKEQGDKADREAEAWT